MTIRDSQNETPLESLTSQAVSLASKIVRDIDKKRTDTNLSNRKIRHLAVVGFDIMSKLIVQILEKSKTRH